MSKDNVKQLFGKMEKDVELQKKYAALIHAHQIETEKALSDKLAELGKIAGFSFSKDDLLAARAELMDKFNENQELSEEDLLKVSGGNTRTKVEFGFLSIVTFVIGCGVTGMFSTFGEEINTWKTCGDVMSLTKRCDNITGLPF